jgi:hypothetical protein
MVHVAKFESVGDWEGLYVDGELVGENHIGRVDVLSHLEGVCVDPANTGQVNLPEGVYSYPETLEEVIEDERFDYDGKNYE